MFKITILSIITLVSIGVILGLHFITGGQLLGIFDKRTNIPKVGLQAGHWKINELPDEFKHIRENDSGAEVDGIKEWEVNYNIATQTAALLRKQGIVVDILPATVPAHYIADAFISIHSDASEMATASGFKAAAAWDDKTGKAKNLANILKTIYPKETGLGLDDRYTDNMYKYYVFNWPKRTHAIDPSTPGVIVETGFMTNPNDFDLLLNHPDIIAKGLADSIEAFLKQ